jgi:hypothetical protein
VDNQTPSPKVPNYDFAQYGSLGGVTAPEAVYTHLMSWLESSATGSVITALFDLLKPSNPIRELPAAAHSSVTHDRKVTLLSDLCGTKTSDISASDLDDLIRTFTETVRAVRTIYYHVDVYRKLDVEQALRELQSLQLKTARKDIDVPYHSPKHLKETWLLFQTTSDIMVRWLRDVNPDTEIDPYSQMLYYRVVECTKDLFSRHLEQLEEYRKSFR